MKNTIIALLLAVSLTAFLTGCSSTKAPQTDAEKAAAAGMSQEEYQQLKEKSAQMNMSPDEHMHME